ncbi:MAG: Modification methylase HhaI [Candidatus Dichloromethanomonas elyunquensis]|nr:MAG: Modification methylase HhaI [Candidatus Dichloromethanomonas elyunquensis]
MAAEWAGFETVGQCEFADYPTKVLEKHWPDVPRWRDIRNVTAESIRSRGIREITLLSGGFPCQPHSVAGKHKGSDDERNLWPEFCRVISETSPKWVLGENVPGIYTSDNRRFFGRVLNDLASLGYYVGWATYGAIHVGAKHRRERVFIVAYAKGSNDRRITREFQKKNEQKKAKRQEERISEFGGTGEILANSNSSRLQAQGTEQQTARFEQCCIMANTEGITKRGLSIREGKEITGFSSSSKYISNSPSKRLQDGRGTPMANTGEKKQEFKRCDCLSRGIQITSYTHGSGCEKRDPTTKPEEQGQHSRTFIEGRKYWEFEPDVGRVANGVPSRVDRLKCLGNAVVPQQVFPILKTIAQIERCSNA